MTDDELDINRRLAEHMGVQLVVYYQEPGLGRPVHTPSYPENIVHAYALLEWLREMGVYINISSTNRARWEVKLMKPSVNRYSYDEYISKYSFDDSLPLAISRAALAALDAMREREVVG